MMEFFIKPKLINPCQHGFLKAIYLSRFKEIIKWVDEGSLVGLDVIYLDFQTAFDKVPHQRLIQKTSVPDTKISVI